MANEVAFAWDTGGSVKGKVWQDDGSYRLSDITMTETQTGLYLGDCATIATGDFAVILDRTTSDVLGAEQYEGATGAVAGVIDQIYSDTTAIASDHVLEVAVDSAISDEIDKIYSDTATINSDHVLEVAVDASISGLLTQVYSDTTIALSDLKVTDAAVGNIYSDTTIALSDLLVIGDAIDSVYSDTTISTSDLATIKGKVGSIYSDTTILVSDTAVITDLVRLKVHEFHLGNI
uniref:Uncharacterized protein n=1 Tax=viral metagenome TaxID=1070528 RepID=A0A6M3IIZ9_9ZZZZ